MFIGTIQTTKSSSSYVWVATFTKGWACDHRGWSLDDGTFPSSPSEVFGPIHASKSLLSGPENFKKFSIFWDSEFPFLRFWNQFFCGGFGFLSLMAIAMSLGKRSWCTKACMIVVTKRDPTMTVAMTERRTARTCVTIFVTSVEYLMVAMAAPVMGKVYAHQASENLMIQNKMFVR